MRGCARSVVPYNWILSKCNARADNLRACQLRRLPAEDHGVYLLRHIFHVLFDHVATSRMKEYWKTPRVSESNEVGLPREVFHIENHELSDLVAGNLRFVYPISKSWMQHCIDQSELVSCLKPYWVLNSREVHTKCALLYFLFSKSAMRQSTIWDCGVRK